MKKQDLLKIAVTSMAIATIALALLMVPYVFAKQSQQNTPPAEYLTQNNSVYAPLGGRGQQ